jgi:hypothetical protein
MHIRDSAQSIALPRDASNCDKNMQCRNDRSCLGAEFDAELDDQICTCAEMVKYQSEQVVRGRWNEYSNVLLI